MRRSRRGRSLFCSLFVVPLFLATPAWCGDLDSVGVLDKASLSKSTLSELRQTVRALQRNTRAQVKVWPTRDADQADEKIAPPAVRRLQEKYSKLERKKERLLRRLRNLRASAIDHVLKALDRARDRAFFDALVPLAVKIGRNDEGLVSILERSGERFVPFPMSATNGLADLQNERASLALLEIGMKETSLAILCAAGRGGVPVVVGQLIAAADSDDRKLAKLCRRAVARLTPPSREVPGLSGIVAQRIMEVRSEELKTSLVVYLGLCGGDEVFSVLRTQYRENRDKRVRMAIIGAMGNLGTEVASEFVLDALHATEGDLTLGLRKSCIHALGAARCRTATPLLIDFLSDRQLNSVASNLPEPRTLNPEPSTGV